MDPEKSLISNINLIDNFTPVPSEVKGVVKEGLFSVLNLKGFSTLLYFFINLVNKEKCKSIIVWPCLNKKDEIQFRKGACEIINEICANATCDILQTLNPSLIFSPVGPKATEFMFRLSTYALKQLAEKKFPNVNVLDYNCIPSSSIIFEARENLIKGINYSNEKQIQVLLQAHKRYAYKYCDELRQLTTEQEIIENYIEEAQVELKKLHENYAVKNYINFKKLNSGDKIDASIQKWSNKIADEKNNLVADVQVINNFEKTIDVGYQLVKDVMDNEMRVKLDGKAFIVSIPQAISNQVVLYQNDDLILENFFKVGFEVVRTLHDKLAATGFSDFFNFSPSVRAVTSDISLCQKEFSNIFSQLYQFQLTNRHLVDSVNYSRGSGLESPLKLCEAQTPPVVFSSSDRSHNNVGIPLTEGDVGRFLLWFVNKRSEKSNVASENESIKVVSRLKQPTKIGLFGSSKASNSVQISEVRSPNKDIISGKNVYSAKNKNKENITPKKSVNMLSNKSNTTPKRNANRLDFNATNTNVRYRHGLFGLRNRLTTNNGNDIDLEGSVSAVTLFSSPNVLANESVTKVSDFAARDEPKEFEEALLNLSEETLPSDLDSSNITTTPSKMSDEVETVGSPSGIVENTAAQRKFRQSMDRLVDRFRYIKMRQKEDKVEEILRNKNY